MRIAWGCINFDRREEKTLTLLILIFSFFQVGLFSFGGGYAAMPLIQHQVVDIHGFLNAREFLDIITISQMTPGPVGINCATFTGVKAFGVLGGIVGTLSFILPSCFIVTILAIVYKKYKNLSIIQTVLKTLRPAVVALIGAAGFSIVLTSLFGSDSISINFSDFNILSAILIFLGILILQTKKINPMYVMLLGGVIGGALFYFTNL